MTDDLSFNDYIAYGEKEHLPRAYSLIGLELFNLSILEENNRGSGYGSNGDVEIKRYVSKNFLHL